MSELSRRTMPMYNERNSPPIAVLFEDRVTLSDERAKRYPVLLQLTSESLIIRWIHTGKESAPRNVLVARDPITRSFGLSIKGGRDTGFPVVISRALGDLLHIGDVILAINNEEISDLAHNDVIAKLRGTSSDQVNLTVQYRNEIATYLYFGHAPIREYPLLYAYTTQYSSGTGTLPFNSFRLHTSDGSRTGILLTCTSIQQTMWISRINLVISHLTKRTLEELNRSLLPREQVFYAQWIHERVVNPFPECKAVFLVFKAADLYIFDEGPSPPLHASDFIRCRRIYSIIETILMENPIDAQKYSFTLALPTGQCRDINFERKNDYEEFRSNYQRALHIAVYSIRNRAFGCVYNGRVSRLIIDINKGLAMYDNQTNLILWTFKFEQLQSSSDNGRDRIYFRFKHSFNVEIQCLDLRIVVHVMNAFFTAKLLG